MNSVVRERGAAVTPVPPPVYYAAVFAAGLGLQDLVPLGFGRSTATVLCGLLLVATGVALAAAGVVAVLRHRTTIVPHRPVSTLVVRGPYRISRNPMYAGSALAYAGGALLAQSWWPLLGLPIVLALVFRLAIRPEERYLSTRYGDEYATYQREVRRWL